MTKLSKMAYYSFSLKNSFLWLLVLFCGCEIDNSQLLDTQFVDSWKHDIHQGKKACSKYIGSETNSLDRAKVIDILDSIYSEKRFKVESIRISNWSPKSKYQYKPTLNPEVFFDVAVNNKLFHRITIKRNPFEFQVAEYEKDNIYFSDSGDVMGNDRASEFAYVHYVIRNEAFELKNIHVFCSESKF